MLRNKKILLTGATGFVGGHMAERLIHAGPRVFCTLRKPKPESYFYKTGLFKKVVLVKCDLNKPKQVNGLFKKEKFDFVFHFAGVLRPKNIQEAWDGNIAPTLNLLQALGGQKQIQGILLASTTRSKSGMLSEKDLTELSEKPYDLSKTLSDFVAESYSHHKKLPVVILKCPNVFGPGDETVKPLRLTSAIIEAIKKQQPFSPSGNKKSKISVIYVKDVAEKFIEVASNIAKYKYKTINLKPGGSFNIETWEKHIRRVVKNKKAATPLEKAILETYNWQ